MRIDHVLPAIFLFSALLAGTGCMSVTKREYKPFVRELDEKSELSISTYPAFFPQDKMRIPFIYRAVETYGELNFQIHVRDRVKKFGKNPHVKTLQIHSFSYQLPGGPEVELLTDWFDSFWMQTDPKLGRDPLPPIKYIDGGVLAIKIRLTLNGEDYSFEGKMPATRVTTYSPLFRRRIGN